MDCRLPGSSIHGIFQARVLEWVAIYFSRRSSQPRDPTQVSRIAGRSFTIWATREARSCVYGIFPRQEYWSGLPFPSPSTPPKKKDIYQMLNSKREELRKIYGIFHSFNFTAFLIITSDQRLQIKIFPFETNHSQYKV